MMSSIRRILYTILFAFILIVIGILVIEYTINYRVNPYVYEVSDTIPKRKVGLLLGTSKRTADGRGNLYYKYRLLAALELYKKGKIDHVLVSGDNGTKYYNEPNTIKKDLIKLGIPEDRITLDFAGFRTLDSVIRAREVFGEKQYTIISQPFHNKRALFIAKAKNIDAIAFNARSVDLRYGYKVQIRERLARVKMMLDLIFNKKPKFLGEEITIG